MENERVSIRTPSRFNPLKTSIMNSVLTQRLRFLGVGLAVLGRQLCLFSVDDGFVDGIPASSGDAPIVGGVLVAVDSDLASFDFFVSIDTHDTKIFFV